MRVSLLTRKELAVLHKFGKTLVNSWQTMYCAIEETTIKTCALDKRNINPYFTFLSCGETKQKATQGNITVPAFIRNQPTHSITKLIKNNLNLLTEFTKKNSLLYFFHTVVSFYKMITL